MNRVPRAWLNRFSGKGELVLEADDDIRQRLESDSPPPDDKSADRHSLLRLHVSGRGKLSLGPPSGRLVLQAGARAAVTLDLAPPTTGAGRRLILTLTGNWSVGGRRRTVLTTASGAGAQVRLSLTRPLAPATGLATAMKQLLADLRLPGQIDHPAACLPPGTTLALTRTVDLERSIRLDPVIERDTGSLPGWPILLLPATSLLSAGLHLSVGDTRRSRLTLSLAAGTRGPEWLAFNLRHTVDQKVGIDLKTSLRIGPEPDVSPPSLLDVLGHLIGLDLVTICEGLKDLTDSTDTRPPDTALAHLIAGEILAPVTAGLADRIPPEEVRQAITTAVRTFLDLDDRLQALLVRHAGNLTRLATRLDRFLSAARTFEIGGPLARFLAGEGLPLEEILDSDESLRHWQAMVRQLVQPPVRATLEILLAKWQGRLRTDRLLELLAGMADPDTLRSEVNSRLTHVLEHLFQCPLSAIPARRLHRLRTAARRIHRPVDTLEHGFQQAMTTLLTRRLEMEAAFSSTHDNGRQNLARGEIRLDTPLGRRTWKRLRNGDLDALPIALATGDAWLNRADLRRSDQRSLTAAFHFGPWGIEALESVGLDSRMTIRARGESWTHTLDLAATARRRRTWRPGRHLDSEFRLEALTRMLLPDVRPRTDWTPPRLEASYDLNATDAIRRPEELTAMLAPAVRLGLLADQAPAEISRNILATVPSGGEFRLTYHVRVPATALTVILATPFLADAVSVEVLELCRWCFLRHGSPSSWLRVLGGALDVAENRRLFRRRGRLTGIPVTACLGPAQGKRRRYRIRLDDTHCRQLEALFRLADTAGALLQRLGRCTVGSNSRVTLESACVDIVRLHHRLAGWGCGLDLLPHALFGLSRHYAPDVPVEAGLVVSTPDPGGGNRNWHFPRTSG